MRRTGIAGTTLCLGLLIAPSWAQLQPNAPWPSFGKDYQNSRSTTLGAPTNGSVRWTYKRRKPLVLLAYCSSRRHHLLRRN